MIIINFLLAVSGFQFFKILQNSSKIIFWILLEEETGNGVLCQIRTYPLSVAAARVIVFVSSEMVVRIPPLPPVVPAAAGDENSTEEMEENSKPTRARARRKEETSGR